MFEIIKPGTKIDFMGRRRIGFLFSGVVMLIGIISLILHGGPNYGIDFAGGTLVQVRFSQPLELDVIRDALKEAGLESSSIQGFEAEGKGEYLIRMQTSSADLGGLSVTINDALTKRFGDKGFEVRRIEMVGPKVGKDLRTKGIMATILAMIGMLIYISWRFEFRFAVGGVVAICHDVIVTIGILSLANKEFSIPVLAALLTIVGYSINDTIVVYDRIRENMPRMQRERLEKVINVSVNETLSRTLLTGVSTLMVLIVLFFLGGGVIHDFTFALIVGIVFGTYSSVFIASASVVVWENKFPKKKR
ncbi:MAG: protein-export membrane protein SecF [Deltaproteobacteria bacterium RBG_13_52_11]|nr:MAG: protein-export membrane protein SecF [Deltaproteobacteria bacterium RBG_13_52_11]